jgi:uncharacterized membrane protein YeaQ/YmgE (transglycosylase-associated protein family)
VVLVVGYFVGTLANALPLPGGLGGVEGGMLGAFIGFWFVAAWPFSPSWPTGRSRTRSPQSPG